MHLITGSVSRSTGVGVISDGDGSVRVGPASVGYRLPDETLVFGGQTAALTDAAATCGGVVLGERRSDAGVRQLLERAMEEACAEAHAEAVRAGANPEAVQIVDIEEVPLAYLTTPAVRVRAKAAGPLSWL